MSKAPRILLIEDEEHLAFGIQYNLQAEGYSVTAVMNGPDALDFLREHRGRIDLVILDLMLPGMSGYEVCENLRIHDHEMPVLILSARSMPRDRTRGFDAGADQYLTKPFELDELISRVKNLLARHERTKRKMPARQFSAYQFRHARIDFDRCEVTVGGKPVRMTRLELKLLEYFIRNEGRVIPRGELLQEVWELPASLHTRAPDQFIRRLRKTFESDPASPQHFLTVRDAGYRFVAHPPPAADADRGADADAAP